MKRKPGSSDFSGRIGKIISVFKDKNGNEIQRQKGGPTKKQVKTLPQFEKARRNNSDMGDASRNGKLVRTTFAELIKQVPETTFCPRLVSHLKALLTKKERDEKGYRSLLPSTDYRNFTRIFLDKHNTKELVAVKMKRHDPDICVLSVHSAPKVIKESEATHYQITSYLYDYFTRHPKDEHLSIRELLRSNLISLDSAGTEEPLRHSFKEDPRSVLFHGVAVVFYQEVDGEYRKLTGNGMNGGWISGIGPAGLLF